ncbi:MAG: hypothetical protein M3120_07060 [Pseudomonadota bacterium]|nr:hypothetical protein [Pseudomonadota bacterium]
MSNDRAVVLHAALPHNKIANMGIVNLLSKAQAMRSSFRRPGSAPAAVLSMVRSGISPSVLQRQISICVRHRCQLLCGAMVTVSSQTVDQTQKLVRFYAPVFDDVDSRSAQPIENYVSGFQAALPGLMVISPSLATASSIFFALKR